MRFEIEIDEEELHDAVKSKVRAAIASQNTRWSADEYIKSEIKGKWPGFVDAIIEEELGRIPEIREKIALEIERILRAKITAAMKAAKVVGE